MNKKHLYIFMVLLMLSMNVQSQSLTPTTMATAGSTATANGFQLDWTVGETSRGTLTSANGKTLLTQGFQQPELQVWTGEVGSQVCPGNTLQVPVTASGIISSSNVFTAELSDANGSFANPLAIGTLKGNVNGNIAAVIPAGTPGGLLYRIRVVSSLPAFTGTDNGKEMKLIKVDIPDAYAYNYGVLANTIYSDWAPAGSITLTAGASNGNAPYTYKWKDSKGTVVSSAAALTVNATGMIKKDETYTVHVTDATGCTQTASRTINVVSVTCNMAKGNKGIEICRNGVESCVSSEQVNTLLQNGAMLGKCSSGIARAEAANVVDAISADAHTSIALAYPNPSISQFTIKLADASLTSGRTINDAISIKVIDLFGSVVEVKTKLASGQTIQLGANYKAGIYFVEITQGDNRQQLKLVKLQ